MGNNEPLEARMHKNWVRHDCFKVALKRYPYKNTEELIEESKKIERYVFDTKSGEVLDMVQIIKKKQ